MAAGGREETVCHEKPNGGSFMQQNFSGQRPSEFRQIPTAAALEICSVDARNSREFGMTGTGRHFYIRTKTHFEGS